MHIEPFRIADDMSLVLYIYEYFDIVAVIDVHIGRSYPNGYLVLGIRNVVNRLLLVSINFYSSVDSDRQISFGLRHFRCNSY